MRSTKISRGRERKLLLFSLLGLSEPEATLSLMLPTAELCRRRTRFRGVFIKLEVLQQRFLNILRSSSLLPCCLSILRTSFWMILKEQSMDQSQSSCRPLQLGERRMHLRAPRSTAGTDGMWSFKGFGVPPAPAAGPRAAAQALCLAWTRCRVSFPPYISALGGLTHLAAQWGWGGLLWVEMCYFLLWFDCLIWSLSSPTTWRYV